MSNAIAQLIIQSHARNDYEVTLMLGHYRSLPTFGKRLGFLARTAGFATVILCIYLLVAGVFSLIGKSLKGLAHLILTSVLYGRALEWLYERSDQKAYLSYCINRYKIQKLSAQLATMNAKLSDAYRSLRGMQAYMCDETRRAAYAALEEAGRNRDELAALVARLRQRNEVAYTFERVGLLERFNRLGHSA